MYATATLTGADRSRRVVAEPKAAISMCEPLVATVDPAFGAGLDDLPCRVLDADLWFAESPGRPGASEGVLRRLPGPHRVPGRRARSARAVGRMGRRNLQSGRDHRAEAAARPPSQERGRGMTVDGSAGLVPCDRHGVIDSVRYLARPA